MPERQNGMLKTTFKTNACKEAAFHREKESLVLCIIINHASLYTIL